MWCSSLEIYFHALMPGLCISEKIMVIHPIRQRSDYITEVKDHRWASNWITLEFDWTVQDCTQWRMVGSLKIQLVYKLHLFSTLFQLRDECNNICVAFLENLFTEFTSYMINPNTFVGLVGKVQKKLSPEGGRQGGWRKKRTQRARRARGSNPGPAAC